jgi:uncharacterized PurR-regulated membrane protein YhhQ (DUF165 family)
MKDTKIFTRTNIKTAALVASYLGAIVAANIAVAHFGPAALLFTAVLLIPFDLCARDLLHERWHEYGGLLPKMAVLVAAGSLLSYLASPSSGRVALASCAAFGTAATVDTAVYQLLARWPKQWKMNASNFCSAITDSIIFPIVAFGSTTLRLSAGQSAAKFAGGIFWTWLFVGYLRRRAERRVERRLEENLMRAGLLKHRRPPITDFSAYEGRTPIQVKGRPVSETIIEDRR